MQFTIQSRFPLSIATTDFFGIQSRTYRKMSNLIDIWVTFQLDYVCKLIWILNEMLFRRGKIFLTIPLLFGTAIPVKRNSWNGFLLILIQNRTLFANVFIFRRVVKLNSNQLHVTYGYSYLCYSYLLFSTICIRFVVKWM